jgi:hypothetical protein
MWNVRGFFPIFKNDRAPICLVLGMLGLFSSCSPQFYRTLTLSIDGQTMVAPTNWALTGISDGATSPLYQLEVTGSYLEDGATVALFTDPACSIAFGTPATVASGDFSVTADNSGDEGEVHFYYVLTTLDATVSICSDSQLNYNYQKPKFAFSNPGYSVTDKGDAYIGDSIRVIRDVTGINSTVTVYFNEVSAQIGTHFSNPSATLNFTTTDTYLDVPVTDLGIIDTTATTTQDRVISLRLETDNRSKAEASASARNLFSQVNIIDSQITNSYWFDAPLYTANDGDSQVTLTVKRLSDVGDVSVNVIYSDITATAGADYDTTTTKVDFLNGSNQTTLTIPISNVSSNKSFFVYLEPGHNVNRTQSATKVRILNKEEDTSACDSSIINNFGGGVGTPADPYLVCNAYQLSLIRTKLEQSFKIMADIDIDPSLDTDANSGGVEPFTTIDGVFEGNVDGNERVIANFRFDAGGMTSGFFKSTDAPTASDYSIQKFNLLSSRLINTGPLSGLLVGQAATTSYSHLLYGNMTSGFILTAGSGTGLMVGGIEADPTWPNDLVVEWSHNLTAGLIEVGAGAELGGLAGRITLDTVATPQVEIKNNFSSVDILGGNGSFYGGLIGNLMQFSSTPGGLGIKNNYYSGQIDNIGEYAGGILGKLSSRTESMIVSNNITQGKVSTGSAKYLGGLIGYAEAALSSSLDMLENKNYMDVLGDWYIGGLVGYAEAGTQLTITKSSNEGNLDASTQGYVGGLVGSTLLATDAGLDVQLSSSISEIYGNGYLGGLFGALSTDVGNSTVRFTDCFTQGIVDGNSTPGVGGILGELASQSTLQIDFERVYSTAAIQGTSMGGIVGNGSGTGAGIRITDSFWLKDATLPVNVAVANDGNQKDQSQMLDPSTYSNFDFSGVWNPPSGATYPTLR